MSNEIIIVPYRDREEHLIDFLAHMDKRHAGMPICIVEQSDDDKPFNRAKLLNIGFLENQKYSHFIFHDVDMLPIDVAYTIKYTVPVVQLASSDIQLFDYLGGVTRFTRTSFIKVGGYNNDYFHRAEDNEMMFNLKRLNIGVIRKPGKYKYLEHERKGPEFDPGLWELAQQPRKIQDHLSKEACRYKIIKQSENNKLKHIIAEI